MAEKELFKEEKELDSDKLKKLEGFIDNLHEKEGNLILILHEAQEIFGYLSDELQLWIARKLDIPAAKVFGVVTFYSQFSTEPRGKHLINICMGTACFVKGADKLVEEFQKQLNIKDGNTTADGMFTVNSLRCIGACGLAPVVMVGEKVFGRVKVEEVTQIINEFKG